MMFRSAPQYILRGGTFCDENVTSWDACVVRDMFPAYTHGQIGTSGLLSFSCIADRGIGTAFRAMRIGTETHTYGQTAASGLTAAQASERCIGGRPLLRRQIAASGLLSCIFTRKEADYPDSFMQFMSKN